MDPDRLTHLNAAGDAQMVDVGDKAETRRQAQATGTVVMRRKTLDLIEAGGVAKGDVLAVARLAGIMAAKRTSDLIPLCHPLALTHVEVGFTPERDDAVEGEDADASLHVVATVRTRGRTGVEMEALTAVCVAALTIYDMCKAVDRAMRVTDVYLVRKEGGKSGPFVHPKKRTDAPLL
jgi:cyclic pyranopterin phosphate synthase